MGGYPCINVQKILEQTIKIWKDKDGSATDTCIVATSQTMSGDVDSTAENDYAACREMLHSLVNDIPYTWNFSRYVNFTDFAVSRAAVKIYSVKNLPPCIILII